MGLVGGLFVLGVGLEIYAIVSYLLWHQALVDAWISLASSLFFGGAIVLSAYLVSASRAAWIWAALSALFYIAYKTTDLLVTIGQTHPTGAFSIAGRVDGVLVNLLLLSSGATLLLCFIQALLEARRSQLRLEEQNRALAESRERFLQIADQTREVIWEVDTAGLYTYLSRACATVWGYLPEELVGCAHFYDLHPAEGREEFRRAAFEQMACLLPFEDLANPVLHKDGRILDVLTSGLPVMDGRGALLGYRGTDRDVTRLRESRARHRLLTAAVENAAESIVITDQMGIITYVNPAFEKLTGYESAEVIGGKPGILRSGHHPASFYRDFWNTLLRGEVWRGQFINRSKAGTLFEESATVSPIRDKDGAITNFVAVKRDVTHELEMERQLRQRMRLEAVGTFASGIAHDFNSVLSLMIGHTDIARDMLGANHPAQAPLETALRAGYRSSDMIRKLLTFTRHQHRQPGPILVGPQVAEDVSMLTTYAPGNVQVTLDISPVAGLANVEPGALQQVVINLCSNALQAMQEKGGMLGVSVERITLEDALEATVGSIPPGCYVRLRIRDTGPGISAANLPRIFDPFFTTKEAGQGTGLGLSMLATVVTGWYGALSVRSEPGVETVFDVFIPAVSADPAQ